MDAVAIGNMRVGAAANIKGVWLLEDRLISVGRLVEGDDTLVCFDDLGWRKGGGGRRATKHRSDSWFCLACAISTACL